MCHLLQPGQAHCMDSVDHGDAMFHIYCNVCAVTAGVALLALHLELSAHITNQFHHSLPYVPTDLVHYGFGMSAVFAASDHTDDAYCLRAAPAGFTWVLTIFDMAAMLDFIKDQSWFSCLWLRSGSIRTANGAVEHVHKAGSATIHAYSTSGKKNPPSCSLMLCTHPKSRLLSWAPNC